MNSSDRRWFRFNLRTLFAQLTVLGVCLGWFGAELRTVRLRANLLVWCAAHGGEVDLAPDLGLLGNSAFAGCFSRRPADIGWIRKQLGDRPVESIYFETAPSLECQRELTLRFSEADLAILGTDGNLHSVNRHERTR